MADFSLSLSLYIQTPAQPKAPPRAHSKVEEATSPQSPPARPQPPVLKSTPSVGEAKKDDSTAPARPTPPKPVAAPREQQSSTPAPTAGAATTTSSTAPAKPPALRPKPPPKMPKPARPATVIDVPNRSKIGKSISLILCCYSSFLVDQ